MSASLPSSRTQPALAALAMGASTVLFARVAGAGLNYGLQILFARWAGASHYGAYSYALAWAALISTLAGLGLPQAIVRFIPEYVSAGRWSLLRGVIQYSERCVLGASSALAIACVVFAWSLDMAPQGTVLRAPLLLGFCLIPALALLRLQTEMCIARQQARIAYLFPSLLRPLLMMGGGAVIVLWLDMPLTGPLAVLLAGLPLIPMWLVQRWSFRHQLPAEYWEATPARNTSHWMRTALPMLFITGFLLLLSQTDLLMIGLLADVEYVGLYKVATKTASLVLFPLLAVNAIMAPRFAGLYAQGEGDSLQRLASVAAHWMLWPSVLIALGLVVLSGFLLGLFGASFVRAELALWILIAGQLANVGAGAVGPLLTMTGYQRESARVYGVCALLNMVLNAVGIYYFGMAGAAAATAVSTALWNVGLYRLVVAKLGVYPSVMDPRCAPWL